MPRSGASHGSRSTRRRVAVALCGLAQLGHAHWFFGNLYEAIVKVPDRLALSVHTDVEQAVSPLGPGSPVRYYAAAAPATLPAVLAAGVFGWDDRNSRAMLAAAAGCSILGGAAGAYLVRAVNMRLFFDPQPLAEGERDTLLRTWYLVNGARLVVTGAAGLAAHKARARLAQ